MFSVEVVAIIPTEIANKFRVQFWLNGLLITSHETYTKELLMGNLFIQEDAHFEELTQKDPLNQKSTKSIAA
jgi:hypothetical protein